MSTPEDEARELSEGRREDPSLTVTDVLISVARAARGGRSLIFDNYLP